MAKRKFKDPYDVREAYPYEKKDNSPYWAWAWKNAPTNEQGEVYEPWAANLDQFPGKPEPERSEEMEAVIELLNSGGLDRLPVRQRRAFKLVALEGLTYKEAGKRMNISAMTVHEHVRDAGRKLRKMCEDKL